MTGGAAVLKADARSLPLPDESVDLVVTSPPYFALRSYTDDGSHYDGQVGAEGSPQEYVDALIEATREMVRVLKPEGSIFLNLGDKYASAGGHTGQGETSQRRGRSNVAQQNRGTERLPEGMPQKSLMLLPERYRIAAVDRLGLIARAVIVWSKPNGLPESVTDRVRRSHEDWVHLTRRPRYYSAVDEIREPYGPESIARRGRGREHSYHPDGQAEHNGLREGHNHLGALPGSVWTIPTEPLRVPDWLGIDHFAAFPTEWPRRLIEGFSPSGICTECGEGRRPVMGGHALDDSRPQARRARELADEAGLTDEHLAALKAAGTTDVGRAAATQTGTGKNTADVQRLADEAKSALGGYSREFLLARGSVTGYSCGCAEPTAPTRPAVVLDPFGGTGTTALVARALGRHAVTVDLSHDYCRLAAWRVNDADQLQRVRGKHYADRQGVLV